MTEVREAEGTEPCPVAVRSRWHFWSRASKRDITSCLESSALENSGCNVDSNGNASSSSYCCSTLASYELYSCSCYQEFMPGIGNADDMALLREAYTNCGLEARVCEDLPDAVNYPATYDHVHYDLYNNYHSLQAGWLGDRVTHLRGWLDDRVTHFRTISDYSTEYEIWHSSYLVYINSLLYALANVTASFDMAVEVMVQMMSGADEIVAIKSQCKEASSTPGTSCQGYAEYILAVVAADECSTANRFFYCAEDIREDCSDYEFNLNDDDVLTLGNVLETMFQCVDQSRQLNCSQIQSECDQMLPRLQNKLTSCLDAENTTCHHAANALESPPNEMMLCAANARWVLANQSAEPECEAFLYDTRLFDHRFNFDVCADDKTIVEECSYFKSSTECASSGETHACVVHDDCPIGHFCALVATPGGVSACLACRHCEGCYDLSSQQMGVTYHTFFPAQPSCGHCTCDEEEEEDEEDQDMLSPPGQSTTVTIGMAPPGASDPTEPSSECVWRSTDTECDVASGCWAAEFGWDNFACTLSEVLSATSATDELIYDTPECSGTNEVPVNVLNLWGELGHACCEPSSITSLEIPIFQYSTEEPDLIPPSDWDAENVVLARYVSNKNKIIAGILLHVTRYEDAPECKSDRFSKLYEDPGCLNEERSSTIPKVGIDAVYDR
ncbi:hypothetical protein CYMTET_31435, partial [Cymbomonas tetramitiformis]